MTDGTWMMFSRRRGSPGAPLQSRSATTSGCARSIKRDGRGPPLLAQRRVGRVGARRRGAPLGLKARCRTRRGLN